jgi:predicted RNA-binding Zn-ribbon protein involved in translation (DUF1610 family)
VADLERFFERLVRNLIASDPARLRAPVPILEIRNTIMPYRTNRRALGLESADEYEELLVRLCAEEGGYVTTAPREVAEWCQRQMSTLSPDLSGIPGQGTATVTVNAEAAMRVLGSGSRADLGLGGGAGVGAAVLPLPPERCAHCDAELPTSRAVNFCPSCGRSVTLIPCAHCGTDLEPGWRFCVNCGHEVSQASAGG